MEQKERAPCGALGVFVLRGDAIRSTRHPAARSTARRRTRCRTSERWSPACPCGSRRSVLLTSSLRACGGPACAVPPACAPRACVQQAYAGPACAVRRACELRACVQRACGGPACAGPRACVQQACAVLRACAELPASAPQACAVRACAVLPASAPRACGELPACVLLAYDVLQAYVPPAYVPPASGERSNGYARSTFSSLVPWSSSFERCRSFRGNAGKYARCIGCHSAKLLRILLLLRVRDNASSVHFTRNLRVVVRVDDAKMHVTE